MAVYQLLGEKVPQGCYLQKADEARLRACVQQALQSVAEFVGLNYSIDQFLDEGSDVPLDGRRLFGRQFKKVG